MSGIAVEVSSRGVATITLDRPERSNAFDQAMLNALAQQFAERTADAATRIVVLRGAGKHFCLGSQVARLVTEVSMKRFLERVPEYHLSKRKLAWNSSSNFRSPIALPFATA